MAIHKTDNGTFVISSHHCWLPGIFEDERSARWAFRFPDEVLERLQREANVRAGGKGGVITHDDLKRVGRSSQAYNQILEEGNSR
jgi:hypothetical protein